MEKSKKKRRELVTYNKQLYKIQYVFSAVK